MADFRKLPGKPKIVLRRNIGRWWLTIVRHYDGEQYGYKGSDSWTLRVTLTREANG